MESVSGASRDSLLSQIELTGEMIQQAGLIPADIFRDVAENTEHFAAFAKDGGDNIVKSAMAAKKLGLNLANVSSIAEGLLDFESSIEAQMEASMLLGREINMDRARMLSLTGDHEGMMKEILKQVGGEAAFSKMNVLQRRALARSAATDVETLSRLVKNQGQTATASAMKEDPGSEKVAKTMEESGKERNRLLRQISGKLD